MAKEEFDIEKLEKEENWHPVTLKEVIGERGDRTDKEVDKLLGDKGYFLLRDGRWQSPDANTVITDYKSVEKESIENANDAIPKFSSKIGDMVRRRQSLKKL